MSIHLPPCSVLIGPAFQCNPEKATLPYQAHLMCTVLSPYYHHPEWPCCSWSLPRTRPRSWLCQADGQVEWPAAIWTPSPLAPGCLEGTAYLPGHSPAFWQERPGRLLRGPQPLPPGTGDKSGLVSPLGAQPTQLFPAAPPCASAQPVSHKTSPLLPDCVAPRFCLWLVRGQDRSKSTRLNSSHKHRSRMPSSA